MGYRKIEIDGTTYEYVVGAKFIKIRGMQAYPITDYGNPIGIAINTDSIKFHHTGRYEVTPAIIKGIITGNKLPQVQRMADPLAKALRQKERLLDFNAERFYLLTGEANARLAEASV